MILTELCVLVLKKLLQQKAATIMDACMAEWEWTVWIIFSGYKDSNLSVYNTVHVSDLLLRMQVNVQETMFREESLSKQEARTIEMIHTPPPLHCFGGHQEKGCSGWEKQRIAGYES